MNNLHNLLEKYNIWYELSFGSLLGAVRHSDIIPHDDMDIIVWKRDQNNFDNIIFPLLEKQGYKIEKTWKLYRVYSDANHFIDIFFINDINNKIYRNVTGDENIPNKNNVWWWKWFGFPSFLINNRKLFRFNKYYFYGPFNPKELLFYWYGNNYL